MSAVCVNQTHLNVKLSITRGGKQGGSQKSGVPLGD